AHKGAAFVEIYQDCNVFNHQAFGYATGKVGEKEDNILRLEHGKPMIFGKNRDKGIRMNGAKLEVVELGNGVTADDLLFHDETDESLAFARSRLRYPAFPEPIGVYCAVEDRLYEDLLTEQVQTAVEQRGRGTLERLLNMGETYE